jgi:TolB-like protein/Flp pilus assembly protein TadD
MASVVRFGSFELDIESRELTSAGAKARLQDQPFEILRLLLEQPGHVVTRDRIRDRLWPAGTFVDFEHSLNAAVKRLRAALGDDADAPQFIETVPRRGYRFIGCSVGDEPPEPSHRVRLAVLPFSNLSADREREFFSDGLTEEMTSQLVQVCGAEVGVIACQSALHFKHSTLAVRAIGEALRADYVLEGSVRWEGDRVRINARLVRTTSETQVWADRYDRLLTDCLAVQADVAEQIARALSTQLSPRTPAPAIHDGQAYQALLKGRYYWRKPGDSGMDQALHYYEEAVRFDPACAAAHASVAKVHVYKAECYHERPRAAFEKAERAVQCALTLDPALPEALACLADLRRYLHADPDGARTTYRRAMAHARSHGASVGFARLLAAMGQFPQAIREADRARELDPMCLAANTTAAWVRYLAGDYDTAANLCRDTLELEPSYLSASRLLSQALLAMGRPREALRTVEHTLDTGGSDPVTLAHLAYARATTGDCGTAHDVLGRLLQLARTRYVAPYYLALVHHGLGDDDAASRALAQADEDCDPMVTNLGVDPRFAGFVRREHHPARLPSTA